MLFNKENHSILKIVSESVDEEIDVLNSDDDKDNDIILRLEESDLDQLSESNEVDSHFANCRHEELSQKQKKIRILGDTNLNKNFVEKEGHSASKKQSSLLDYFPKVNNFSCVNKKPKNHTRIRNCDRNVFEQKKLTRSCTVMLERLDTSDFKNPIEKSVPYSQNIATFTKNDEKKKSNGLLKKYKDFLKNVLLRCKECNQTKKVEREQLIICQNCKKAMEYNCQLCGTSSCTFNGILIHRRYCRGENQYFFCDFCDYKHKYKCNLRYHIEQQHMKSNNVTLYHCSTCKRGYKSKYDKAKHEKTCGIPPHLSCKFCSYKIKYAAHIKNHIKTKHIKEFKSSAELENVIKEILKKGEKLRAASMKAFRSGKQQIFESKKSFYVSERINRYCSKCNEIKLIIGNDFKKCCQKCETPFFYECKKCQKRNKSYNVIYNHVKYNCYPETLFRCDQCDYKSTVKGSLREHILYIHLLKDSKDFYTCPKCNKIVKRESEHKKTCGANTVFDCKICPYKTKAKKSFRRHMHRHLLLNETEKNPSEVIEKQDSDKSVRQNKRIEDRTDEESLTRIRELTICYCSKCKKSTTRINRIRRCQKCNSKFTYYCGKEDCNKKFELLNSVSRHILNNHVANLGCYQCQKCFKTFGRLDLMKKHQRSQHSGLIRHFQCDHCPHKSKEKYNLTTHIRKQHTNLYVNYFKCDKCGKKCKSLNSHAYTCGKDKNYQCDICDYRCKLKYRILLHLQMKHVELFTDKVLKCSMCYLEFKNIYLFDEHVKKCIDEI